MPFHICLVHQSLLPIPHLLLVPTSFPSSLLNSKHSVPKQAMCLPIHTVLSEQRSRVQAHVKLCNPSVSLSSSLPFVCFIALHSNSSSSLPTVCFISFHFVSFQCSALNPIPCTCMHILRIALHVHFHLASKTTSRDSSWHDALLFLRQGWSWSALDYKLLGRKAPRDLTKNKGQDLFDRVQRL